MHVYLYRFGLETHIQGYEECRTVIRFSIDGCHDYSNMGAFAQEEAPSAPAYPYTHIMAAYHGALETAQHDPLRTSLHLEAPHR